MEVERHKIVVLKLCSSYGTGLISGLISLLFLPFPPAMASHPTQTQGAKEFSLWSPLESPSRRGFAFCHLEVPISPPALSGKRKGIGKNEARIWFLIYNWLQYVPSILILFKSYHLVASLGYDFNPKSGPTYTNDVIHPSPIYQCNFLSVVFLSSFLLFSVYFFSKFYFMWISLPECIYVHHLYPRYWSYKWLWAASWCWELNPGPLQSSQCFDHWASL